jgi:hypothetical protein
VLNCRIEKEESVMSPSARWNCVAGLTAICVLLVSQEAHAQAIDLLGLGINANFETPDADPADNNANEVTTTNNIGAGWTYTLMGGAAANYGVGDPVADLTTTATNHYCCYDQSPNGGVLPAPFDGRQIGFMNLPDSDSIAQIASIPVGSLLAGQTYSLTVALGARATAAWADVHYAIGLATTSGTDLGTFASLTMAPDVGNQSNIQDLTYMLNINTQAAAFVGQDASIVIRASNGFTGGASPPDFVQANFDNVRLSGTFGAVNPVNAPALTIDRSTGVITLSKTGPTNYNIYGYQLSSTTSGSFNPAAWTKISTAYDQSGNGSVDPNNNWTVLSAAGDRTDLSEAELQGGDGGTLSTAGAINLGAAWLKTPYQDVQAMLMLAGGVQLTVPVNYTGTAIPSGDLNGDADVTGADWTLFKAAQGTNLAGLTAAQRYLAGDLNNDNKQDLADFSQFRVQYEVFNGVGAFEALLASVPEPATGGLLALAFGACIGRRRSSAGRRRGGALPIRAAACLLAMAAAMSAPSTASAQTAVAHWSFDAATTTTGANGILTASDATGMHNATTQFGGAGGAGGPQINSVAGQFGQAADFANINANGQAQADHAWMSFPQLTEIAGPSAGDFSVAAWVKVPDQASWDDNPILADWGNGAANTRRFTYWFQLDNVDGNAGLRPRAQIRAANTPVDPANIDVIATTLSAAQAAQPTPPGTGPTTFDDGQWHHLAWTWTKTPGEMRFYTDGILRHTQVSTQTNHDLVTSDSVIGALGAKRDNNRYFVGGMDETWVFNGALSDQQVSNLLGFNDINGQSLTLLIDQANGQMRITNGAGNPALTISGYEISSASSGLDVGGWTRIASQNAAGFPVGDGSGNGWEASVASSNGKLTEWYLQGSSTLAPGAFVGLGAGYNEALDATDLVFRYTTASGSIANGAIAFGSITPPSNPADFNNSGSVTGADLTIWRSNFGLTTATKATGDANGDGRTDGTDFLIWQRNLGATSSVAATGAVPEPSALALVALAGVAAVASRRRRLTVAFPAALAVCVVASAAAQAAVTVDRNYRFGDDPAEFAANSVGGVVGAGTGNVTYDSAGVTATGTLHDLEQGNGPLYAHVGPSGLARPGATANQRGITFDGLDDYLRGLRLGLPSTTASSTTGGGTLNYKGLSNRGFQLWVRPSVAGTGTLQSVVLDTNQHGVQITAANRWSLRYNGANALSTEPVTFDAWSHVMVVRAYGATGANSGSVLYINGKAVAAAAGNYNVNQEFSLVVGADTGDGVGDPFGSAEFFNGTLDDLSMFVLGKTTDGVDRGTFNFRTDNGWAATHLNNVAGDVNQDGSLTPADVTAFVAGWGSVNLVNGLRAGDVTTILDGDLNFDGITNLADAALLNVALDTLGLPALDASALPVPEPAKSALAAALWLSALGRRGAHFSRRRPTVG